LLDRAFTPASRPRLTARYSASQQNPNEVQALLSGLFLVYKAFVSSQDQNRCNFAPSCSEYGLEAVKKLGVIRGGLSTFDRLTRCNGINRNEYPIDPKTMRLADPVRW
jgi:putative membrane protein insertion efficiency factor